MARTAEDILVEVLGNQAIALAKQQARIEALTEELAKAKEPKPEPMP